MSSTYQQVQKMVQKFNQDHLLQFYDTLNELEKKELLEGIQATNFEKIIELYKNVEKIEECKTITPIIALDKEKISKGTLDEYEKIGVSAMKNGEYAVVTMAGGQGTRLAFDGPKGLYDIGLSNHKTLFEIQLDRIKEMSQKLGKNIPWYIMTSKENHADVKGFFEKNNFFDYPSSDIVLFVQSALPMIMKDGKVVLEERYKIKEGSDGNGAIYRCMRDTGVFSDMNKRGVKWFFACNVDNVLVQCVDAGFLGLAISKNAQCISKSLIKSGPHEKVGVFCYKDGAPGVVEYSELSPQMAEMVDENGEFVYGDSHISCTLFSTDLESNDNIMNLPYHTARKKSTYVNDKGEKVTPTDINAYKFEAFIFDAFSYFDRFFVYRVKREDEFAPVKNKEGEDSPQTARELYLDYQKRQKKNLS